MLSAGRPGRLTALKVTEKEEECLCLRPGRQSRRWNRFSALMAPNFTANEGRDEAFGVSLRLRGAALRLPHGPFRINCSLNDSDREIDFVCPLRLLILLFAGFRNAAAAPPGGDRETVEVTPRQGASFTLKRLTSKAPPARSAPLFFYLFRKTLCLWQQRPLQEGK